MEDTQIRPRMLLPEEMSDDEEQNRISALVKGLTKESARSLVDKLNADKKRVEQRMLAAGIKPERRKTNPKRKRKRKMQKASRRKNRKK